MNWNYKGREITEVNMLPENAVGFIYLIEFSNGRKYIGKKALFHKRTRKPLKGYKRKRVDYVESDWKKYNGSIKNEQFHEDFNSNRILIINKTILKVCMDKWGMTYYETKYQFETDCLVDQCYYNQNILGKFYRKKIKTE
jgi:hypothetical protein